MHEVTKPPSPLWDPRFGEHLKAARMRALLSRAQVAARIGSSEESIRRWEHGGARPSPDSLARLIAVLSIDGAAFRPLPPVPDGLPRFARALAAERVQRRISQAQAAAVIGVAQPTYAGWEIGRATPSPQFLGAISLFLGLSGVEVEDLVGTPFTVDFADWPALGRFIGARRQALRLTRDGLAKALHVSPATVTAWELGHRRPRPQRIGALAVVLEADLSRLEALISGGEESQLSALGRLVKSHQIRLGLRLRDVADRVGVDSATLSRWIHGVNQPAVDNLRRLAAAIDVPFSVIREVALN